MLLNSNVKDNSVGVKRQQYCGYKMQICWGEKLLNFLNLFLLLRSSGFLQFRFEYRTISCAPYTTAIELEHILSLFKFLSRW